MTRNQKILFSIVFSILVIGLGFGIYWFFFKTSIVSPPPSGDNIPPDSQGQLPESGEGDIQLPDANEGGQLNVQPDIPQNTDPTQAGQFISEIASGGLVKTTVVTEKAATDAVLAQNGNSLNFYSEEDGLFYRVDKNGKLVKLSDQEFFGVDNVNWAPNSEEGILEFPDNNKVYYNFKTQKQVTLPSHWEEFDFAPNSSQIAFKNITTSEEDNWLAISNPDGTEPKIVAALGRNQNKVQVNWSPNDQVVATYQESTGFNEQEIYFVGKNEENFRLTVADGRDFRPKWFPNGQKLLYSVYNSADGFRPNLWIVDASGGNIGNNRIKLPVQTWSDRCTFNSDGSSLYCARPKEMPAMAGLFPDFIEDESITSEIIKINTTTGRQTRVGEPVENTNILKIIVTETEDTLFFQDSQNNQVKKIQLK